MQSSANIIARANSVLVARYGACRLQSKATNQAARWVALLGVNLFAKWRCDTSWCLADKSMQRKFAWGTETLFGIMSKALLRGHAARIAEWRDAFRRVRKAYIQAHGRSPNILMPSRFTEKMQWRKIFDANPAFTILSDKLAARDFVAARVGCELLTPLLWTGMADEIPFDRITPPFALKSTHASGQVIMVDRYDTIDRAEISRRVAGWLNVCHGTAYDEPAYKSVPRRLLIERTVMTEAGTKPGEVRLFVFNGRVKVINTVFVEDGRVRNGAFLTPDWKRLDWYFTRKVDRDFSRPARLADMISIAERLGEGSDHVRVDIYDGGAHIWVGEVTIYSWSGNVRFNPDEADLELGAQWQLRAPFFRAVVAVFCRRQPFT